MEIEGRVAEAVRGALVDSGGQRLIGPLTDHRKMSSARTNVVAMARGAADKVANARAAVERVVISQTTIEIELAEERVADDQNRMLVIPWTPPSPYRRREIIQGVGEPATRPMRTKPRALLIKALGDAHRWLDELTTNRDQTIEAIAIRDGQTERWVRRILSLAFLCPPLVQAGVEGRLPRGFGVKRLMDLPLIWADQWTELGLKPPIRT